MAEVLGAFGLVLPGLLRIRQGLTPLAAAGLVIIMIGATVVMWAGGMVAVALMNVIVALLAAFVAYGRWRLAPYRDLSRRRCSGPQAEYEQPSRKEQTMSTGGFSKARLGRMHDVMGFFCGLTVGLTLVATPAGIARNVIESMPSSSSSHSSVPRGWL